ncbi:MAG: hypothetical protein LUI07_03465 [Lachnospiraceae bacterium]|nr:hypothetical protein [Lachnospiraceae bacterium]
MSIVHEGNSRLGYFGHDIICLIANEKNESVETILDHIWKGDVVHYIVDKYKDFEYLDAATYEQYDYSNLEMIFGKYYNIEITHDVKPRIGIKDLEKDGLFILLDIILKELSGE